MRILEQKISGVTAKDKVLGNGVRGTASSPRDTEPKQRRGTEVNPALSTV